MSKCQECHPKQYENWKTTKHSKALASLVETNDQHRYDCIGCHSLGYGEAFLDTSKIGAFGDVQCESCHGTNPKHADDPKLNKFSKTARSDCLVCHNNDPNSTKRDWKEGDVGGVLEIVRPLDRDIARTREGLLKTFLLTGAVSGALLAISGLVLFERARRLRASSSLPGLDEDV